MMMMMLMIGEGFASTNVNKHFHLHRRFHSKGIVQKRWTYLGRQVGIAVNIDTGQTENVHTLKVCVQIFREVRIYCVPIPSLSLSLSINLSFPPSLSISPYQTHSQPDSRICTHSRLDHKHLPLLKTALSGTLLCLCNGLLIALGTKQVLMQSMYIQT